MSDLNIKNYSLSDDQAEIESLNSSIWSFFKDPKSFQTIRDFSYVWGYLKRTPSKLRASIFLFALSFACTLLVPKGIGFLVDRVFYHNDPNAYYLVFYFMILYTLKLVFEASYKWSFAKLGENVLKDMRSDINRILSTIPVRFFDLNSSGKIISRGVNDVTNFALIFNPMMYKTIGDVFIIFGSLVILLVMFPLAGIFMSILAFFLFVSLFRFSLLIGRKVRKKRSLVSKVNTYVSDSINGLELIFANGYTKDFKRSYSRLIRLYYLSSEKLIKIWGKFPTIHAFCLGIVFGFLALYFGFKLGAGQITKGELITVIFYSSMIFFPFHDIAARQNEFQDGMSSMSKIKEILSLDHHPETLPLNSGDYTKTLGVGSIQFNNVKFGYEPNNILFDNLSFEIPANKITAIIGRTGSGKTSIVSLITQLYKINSGELKFGKMDISSIPRSVLAKEIGVVTQQLFLFKDTLRENLRLYDSSKTDESIYELLESLDLLEKVKNLPEGLDTVYDDTLQLFSTGEKQLFVIGRMILRNPSILIFDEATANLDNVMENKVQKSLARLLPGRTTIVIAHRLSTIQMAENIVVFSQGEIVESGHPEDLLAAKGHYHSYLEQSRQ